ncbi:MAG: ERCC4 domain-containing protein, partial [Actinomycetia bacterium]|nr:ERCC4 domain-containing protein [Actinomycetes bacterium]
AIDLVLDRGRENRSQFVLTHVRGGREAIFWQTGRTAKQARPRGALPTARASGQQDLTILIDSHERYAWKFSEQQVRTEKRKLAAGDYAIESGGRIVAAVERKSLADLVATLTSGKLRYVLAELAALDHAAVVVEDRYSKILTHGHVRPSVVLDGLGECQARFPAVPVIFAETRALAQEWTFRFFGAALAGASDESEAERRFAGLVAAGPVPEPEVTTAQVRAWAREQGIPVPDRGRLRPEVWAAFRAR